MPYEEPPTDEQVEKKRAGLLAERAWIVSELERLEAPPAEPAQPKHRRR
jgi:hypothetical protein